MSLQQKAGGGGPPWCQEYLLKKFENLEFAAGHGCAAIPVAHCRTSFKHLIIELFSIGTPSGYVVLFGCWVVGFDMFWIVSPAYCFFSKTMERSHLTNATNVGSLPRQWKIPHVYTRVSLLLYGCFFDFFHGKYCFSPCPCDCDGVERFCRCFLGAGICASSTSTCTSMSTCKLMQKQFVSVCF